MLPDENSVATSDVLFENAPCAMVVTREDGKILRANATFCTWLGRSKAALCEMRFQDLLTMGGRIFHQTHWSPLMRMQGSVAEVKLELVHQDRHTITMLLNGVRHESSEGVFYQLALFVTTDRDIYERELVGARKLAEHLLKEKTNAEAALQDAQAELNQAYERAQRRASFAEQMVAIVSHDLKNPLTAIRMASEMLARSQRTDKEALLLNHIGLSTNRAQRMIADLLDFALARAGRRIAIRPVATDLHQVVQQSLDEIAVAFPKATLVHRVCGVGSAVLDVDRVQQIIGNLVANSVAYGDLSQPVTVVSMVEDSTAIISVHNYGSPISEPQMEVLFEPMTRGTQIDNDVRSVGLGLFIVREIATTHGGNVSASSSLAEGTTFRIQLSSSAPN